MSLRFHGWWASALMMGAAGCKATASPSEAPPPIIVVDMDTFRADRMGAPGLTPNLDRFAKESVVFDNAYATANETLFSHASLFTSRYASELSPVDYGFTLPKDIPTLAEVLRNYGYQTGAAVAGGHMTPEFGYGKGFDAYESSTNWGSLFHTMPLAEKWLKSIDIESPFLLWLHGYDTHHRYLKPSPIGYLRAELSEGSTVQKVAIDANGTTHVVDGIYYPDAELTHLLDMRALRVRSEKARQKTREVAQEHGEKSLPLSDSDIAYLGDVYDGAVIYADVMFGLWVEKLKNLGIFDRSIVIVLSDHGEHVGEDGLFNHRYNLDDNTTHVPLIVRMPGGLHGGTHVSTLVSLIDVMPTLLDAANAVHPADIHGRSLWPLLQKGAPISEIPVFSEGTFREVTVRSSEGRLTFSGLGADSPFLLPMLTSSRLEGPSFQGSEGLPSESYEKMRGAMLSWREGLQPSPAGDTHLPPKVLNTLREKGYWGPQ